MIQISASGFSLPEPYSPPEPVITSSFICSYLEGPGTAKIVKRSVVAALGAWTRFDESLNRVEEISKKRGISMAQVSVAWSLARVTAPIIGSTSTRNLEELIGAWDRSPCGKVVMVI